MVCVGGHDYPGEGLGGGWGKPAVCVDTEVILQFGKTRQKKDMSVNNVPIPLSRYFHWPVQTSMWFPTRPTRDLHAHSPRIAPLAAFSYLESSVSLDSIPNSSKYVPAPASEVIVVSPGGTCYGRHPSHPWRVIASVRLSMQQAHADGAAPFPRG